MEVHYISPSLIPSRSANSVHVVHQARALVDSGARVTLYACRSVRSVSDLPNAITACYGVNTQGIRLSTSYASTLHAVNWRIAMFAVPGVIRAAPKVVISRNLYAAYLLAVIARRPLIYEVHDVESGVRGLLQREILRQPRVRTVTISAHLSTYLESAHGTPAIHMRVLHDAASTDILPVKVNTRRAALGIALDMPVKRWHGVCGYVGNLYAGRGIEVMEKLASVLPSVLFLIVGGKEEELIKRRSGAALKNLLFIGHQPHDKALALACRVDILLMPYQASVSLGIEGRDTARWMSPMKMFEYMATSVPIVASDLPVLREVLHDNNNSLLVGCADISAWTRSILRLLADPQLSGRLGRSARAQFLARHTWEQRAHALMSLGWQE